MYQNRKFFWIIDRELESYRLRSWRTIFEDFRDDFISFLFEDRELLKEDFLYREDISLLFLFSFITLGELYCGIYSIAIDRDIGIFYLWVSDEYCLYPTHIFCGHFSFLSYGARDTEACIVIIICGKYIESHKWCEEYEAQYQEYDWDKYRKSTQECMLEKIPKHSLVPLSHTMYDSYTKRDMPISDTRLPFSFEYEELFLFIRCIFDGMWVIDVFFSFSYEEEVEGAIDSKGKDKSRSKYSEYRDRDIGKEFPKYTRKRHHRDEYYDRRHDPRDDRDSILSQCKHDSRLRIISDTKLGTRTLYDHDDSIDCYTEGKDKRKIRKEVHRIPPIVE